MKIVPKLLGDWPKLAWTAAFKKGSSAIEVCHGPMVETAPDWLAEAVWAGDFVEGGFDRTDLVFGTGVRCRGDRVVFVSSGTMLDRLWHCFHRGRFYVSNSLPAMLAVSGGSLREDYDYNEDVKTTRGNLAARGHAMPAKSCDICAVCCQDLLYEGTELRQVEKPHDTPSLGCYADYFGFLTDGAGRLRDNLKAPARKWGVVPLASVSSGYDSGASAVVAKHAGCTQAVTISNATTLLPRSDSGREIATYLGMNCRSYRRTPRRYQWEEAVWAVAGRAAGLNLTVFEFPQPLCLFFSGFCGDAIWAKSVGDAEILVTPSIAGLSEFRLIQGLFHCVVPFWGSRNLREIQAISSSGEMEPWMLHNDYDRPIPRRMLEEAGVPRHLFGNRKEVTSAESSFVWPFSRASRASLAKYLRRHGLYTPSPVLVWLLRGVLDLDHLVSVNLTRKLGLGAKGLGAVLKFKGQDLLFHWANEELTKMYLHRMSTATGGSGGPGPRDGS